MTVSCAPCGNDAPWYRRAVKRVSAQPAGLGANLGGLRDAKSIAYPPYGLIPALSAARILPFVRIMQGRLRGRT